ncbi:hypothetical protein VPH35_010510 [Triticum aestivum]
MKKGKIFKLAKGFRGRAKNCIRIARERVEKALQYSYRDRRIKKGTCNLSGSSASMLVHDSMRYVNYGSIMHGLMKENVQLNRKALVDVSRTAFPGNRPAAKKEGLASIL